MTSGDAAVGTSRRRRMMNGVRELDHELRVALAWLVLAILGWWLHSVPLAIIGALGLVTTIILFLWQRECLAGVTYRRRLGQTKAMFDERVALEVEIVNDKLIPLSWCRVDDDVPSMLDIEGGTVASKRPLVGELVHLMPMLPYQRIRRRLTVVCNHRGEHTFGPATVSSGDPLGLRTRSSRLPETHRLLVYPKVLALAPAGIASKVLIGEVRSRSELLHDPSRPAGVREYRPGDALRDIDWRATARSTSLLVRQFDPTVTLRVALFVDFRAAQLGGWSRNSDELEFTIAVAASIVSDLVGRKIATGLFSSGTIGGTPLAHPASSSPSALPAMLEALAKAQPFGSVGLSGVLAAEAGRLQRGTSVVVVATDFADATLLAIAEIRRRYAVTAVWIETERGSSAPVELVDALLSAKYSDDWQQHEVLELAV